MSDGVKFYGNVVSYGPTSLETVPRLWTILSLLSHLSYLNFRSFRKVELPVLR